MRISPTRIKGLTNIGVIGLGLMGGSFVKAVKASMPGVKIHAVRDHRRDQRLALRARCIDRLHPGMEEMVVQADMIVIATPIDATVLVAQAIKRFESVRTHPLLVIDIASVKTNIARVFRPLTSSRMEFLPTHPMAGSEKSGFQFSAADLFVKRPWIITPHGRNTAWAQKIMRRAITSVSGIPYTLSPETHDQAVASVSHLVFLLSTYLYAFAHDQTPAALRLAGSGFQGMTRLASGSAAMHASILRENRRAIDEALEKFIKFMKRHPLSPRSSLRFFKKYKQARDRQYQSSSPT